MSQLKLTDDCWLCGIHYEKEQRVITMKDISQFQKALLTVYRKFASFVNKILFFKRHLYASYPYNNIN